MMGAVLEVDSLDLYWRWAAYKKAVTIFKLDYFA
jgi:hypothetical protein